MNRGFLVAVAAMAAIVVASNILVQFLVGDWLTWGAFTYPLAFLVTDISNRLYGASQARKVVFFGFIVGLLCSFVGTQLVGEFGPLVTLRIALASGIAFLIAQMLDIAVFDRLRKGRWWRAPLISSALGASVDTLIFFTVAFSAALIFLEPGNGVSWANERVALLGVGPELPLWASLAVADWCVKLGLLLLALGPYRQISKNASSQPVSM